MKIAIRHQLNLPLGEGTPRAVQHLLLTPQSSRVQTVREWQIDMPGMSEAASFIDAYGNRAHLTTQTKPDAEVSISVAGLVETTDRNGVVGRLERDPVSAVFRRQTALTKPIEPVLAKFRDASRDSRDRIALLHALMARVGEVVGAEAELAAQAQGDGVQTQTLGDMTQTQGDAAAPMPEAPRPEPKDFAHAFIGVARALDIPARFVTGYVVATEESVAGFHAWAEAWDEGLGWIGFDPMLGYCPAERHVRVACGLDAVSAMPVRSVPDVGSPTVLEVTVEQAQ